MNKPTPDQIDAILPQTQCGLCGFGGCMPYAEALVNANAAIDLCPPGGVDGLKEIAGLVNQDPLPFIAEMEKKSKPKVLAVIREDACIGCMKCIKACPVDAILGGPKLMHTVIKDECTGCELCVAPCPVDCIDLVAIAEETASEKKLKADQARERYRMREKRLLLEQAAQTRRLEKNVVAQGLNEKKSYILEALERAKLKKSGGG